MKLHVVSDGTSDGTIITDAETGERVEGVQEVRIGVFAYQSPVLAELRIWVPLEHLDLTAQFDVPSEGNEKLSRAETDPFHKSKSRLPS